MARAGGGGGEWEGPGCFGAAVAVHDDVAVVGYPRNRSRHCCNLCQHYCQLLPTLPPTYPGNPDTFGGNPDTFGGYPDTFGGKQLCDRLPARARARKVAGGCVGASPDPL
eukprot:2784046-Rhodomonas_salina.1